MMGKTGLTLLVIAVLLGSVSCRKQGTPKTGKMQPGAPRQAPAEQAPPTAVEKQPPATAQQPPTGTKPMPGAGAGTEPNQAGTARGQTPSGEVTPTAADLSSQKTQPTKK